MKRYSLKKSELKKIIEIFNIFYIDLEPIEDISYLDSGLYSEVYKINNKYVLKIISSTFDVEIEKFKLIQNKKIKNVANIIFIEKLPIKIRDYSFTVIVQEYMPDKIEQELIRFKNVLFSITTHIAKKTFVNDPLYYIKNTMDDEAKEVLTKIPDGEKFISDI